MTGFSEKIDNNFLGITWTVSYSGGHAWLGYGLMEITKKCICTNVITGYSTVTSTSTTSYILCNWGWRGGYDGYYLCGSYNTNEGAVYSKSDTTESSEKYNYQFNHGVILGIRP